MLYGYMGEVLKINLSNKDIKKEKLTEGDLRKFIGGSGLGAKYLFELTGQQTDPLGEDNVLIFMTGPITGIKSFSADRFEVITKSPLTEIFAESNCGGRWGSMLKKSGFDGIIISGRSDKPVNIYINNKEVKILDASSTWGLDTFDTQSKLKETINPRCEIVCIGPAGEKLVRYASIATGSKNSRITGRCGCGTVMGSKKLKAIAVYGNYDINIFDPENLQSFQKRHIKEIVRETKPLHEYGTSLENVYLEEIGNMPVKNWTKSKFKNIENLSGQAMARTILKKKYYCGNCIIGCGRLIEIEKGKYKTSGLIGGPEYETMAMLGSNLFIDNLEAVSKYNEICNRYGLDTMTTGSIIGFMMECYEKGLIDKDELDGIDLKWGDEDAVKEILMKIINRDGIGMLLGEGIRAIVKKLGNRSKEFAAEIKGLDFPAHDPRCKMGTGLGYATSNRGACHLQAMTVDFENGASIPETGHPETYDKLSIASVPEIGIPEPLDRFDVKSKPEFVIRLQNLMCIYDSINCCKFIIFGGIALEELCEILKLTTGFDYKKEEILKIGEGMFNLKRLYNSKCGISRKDDTLPKRFLTQKREDGKSADKLPPLEEMLDDYYILRGWDNNGIPSKEKIDELGLNDFI